MPSDVRAVKFDALQKLTLDDDGWTNCPTEWREAFLPAATGAWATYPKLEELFFDNGSGVMPGRTWVIAPDAETLVQRWNKLIKAPADKKEALFHPHQSKKGLGDRHVKKVLNKGLGSFEFRSISVANDSEASVTPIRYGYRSFDRQWIIPDNRLINRPNPEMWDAHSEQQVYITAPSDRSPSNGPALSVTALIPDLHHYNGRGGRQLALNWDSSSGESNVSTACLALLTKKLGREVRPEELFAYIAAVAAHPAYTERFKEDLVQPGLRVPLSAEAKLFDEAVALGRSRLAAHVRRALHRRQGRPPRLAAEAGAGDRPKGSERRRDSRRRRVDAQ